jgi:hypothetical protein
MKCLLLLCDYLESNYFNPLYPPFLGEIVENLGGHPQTPGRRYPAPPLGGLVAASLALALREPTLCPTQGITVLRESPFSCFMVLVATLTWRIPSKMSF